MTDAIAGPYHRRVRRMLLALGVGLAAGCGGSGTAVQPDPSVQEREQATKALRQRNQELAAQVRELSARLALGEAELRELRATRACDDGKTSETVRIRSKQGRPDAGGDLPWETPDEAHEGDGPRPVLRLYGTRRVGGSRDPGPVPQVPEGLPDRLPVAPMPGTPVASAVTPTGAAGAETRSQGEHVDEVGVAYREGLDLIRQQRFAEAEARFAGIVSRHPRHRRVSDASYWRAEALYALRRYEEALRAFARVLKDHAGSPRAGEAMFKMGLCEKRLGRPVRARALFERVQRDYPGTVAARMAAQEDPS